MKRTLYYSITFLLAFFISALLTAPISLLAPSVPKQFMQIETLSGRIVSGSAEKIILTPQLFVQLGIPKKYAKKIVLNQLHWVINLWSLLWLTPSISLDISLADNTKLRARIKRNFADFSLEAARLQSNIKPLLLNFGYDVPISGHLSINIDHANINTNGSINALSGDANLNQLNIFNQKIADIYAKLKFIKDKEHLLLELSTPGQQNNVNINGVIYLYPDMTYQVDIQLQPKANVSKDLTDMLSLVGVPFGKGRQLKFRKKL